MSKAGRVNRATLRRLREDYYTTWGRGWPHDDDFLRTLWLEAQDKNELGNSRIPQAEIHQKCQLAMREHHEFDAAPAQPDRANIEGATPGASAVLADEFDEQDPDVMEAFERSGPRARR